MESVVVVMSSMVSSSVLVLIVGWLARSLIIQRLSNAIKSEYDQKLETHKAQLKASTELEVEKFKSTLTQRNYEHEVSFGKIHTARIDAIIKLHVSITKTYIALRQYCSPTQDIDSLGSPDVERNYKNAFDVYQSNFIIYRLYLEKSVEDAIFLFNKDCVQTVFRFKDNIVKKAPDNVNDEEWETIEKHISTETKKLLELIEKEFRLILAPHS